MRAWESARKLILLPAQYVETIMRGDLHLSLSASSSSWFSYHNTDFLAEKILLSRSEAFASFVRLMKSGKRQESFSRNYFGGEQSWPGLEHGCARGQNISQRGLHSFVPCLVLDCAIQEVKSD